MVSSLIMHAAIHPSADPFRNSDNLIASRIPSLVEIGNTRKECSLGLEWIESNMAGPGIKL